MRLAVSRRRAYTNISDAILRNCAWNDIRAAPTERLRLLTSSYFGIPSIRTCKGKTGKYKCSKPMRQRNSSVVASAYLLDTASRYSIRLQRGSQNRLRACKCSSPLGGPYISSRAQFRSEARMFEHGMIYRGLPGASGHYDAHFQQRNGLSHTRRTEAAVASVGFV